MTGHMTTDAQTQAIPRVPTAVLAVADAEVAAPDPDAEVAAPDPDAEVAAPDPDAEVAAPDPDAEVAAPDPETEDAAPDPETEDARTESIQEMYEAGLVKLDALHERWMAAVAKIREAQTSGEPLDDAA